MVIEYAGNVIRSIQTDKREKYYDSKVGPPLSLSQLFGFAVAGGHQLPMWVPDPEETLYASMQRRFGFFVFCFLHLWHF